MAYSPEKPKAKKRVTALQVHEISLVDKPAVPDAKILIAKRKPEGGEEVELEATNIIDDVKKLENEDETEIEKAEENPLDKVRAMVSEMMELRRGLPGPIRRTVMEFDMLLDEMTRSEGEGKEARGDEDEPSKKPKPEAAIPGFEGKKEKGVHGNNEDEEDKEDKALPKKPKVKGTTEPKKQEKQCPPGMKLNEETGECEPIKEEAKASKEAPVEKNEDKEEDKNLELELELSEEQDARIDKLLTGVAK